LKTANALLDEFLQHVRPPKGRAIVITENVPNGPDDTNWVATTGLMDLAASARYTAMVVAATKSDRLIDWAGVTYRVGSHRRVAKWLSEMGRIHL
jgi:hypothetical protein